MFVSGERQGSVFILYSCTVFPVALPEVIVLSLLCVLSTFVRTAVCKCMDSFLDSLFHSPGLVLWNAMAMPPGSLQFMLSLKRSSNHASLLIIFLVDFFGYSGSFVVLYCCYKAMSTPPPEVLMTNLKHDFPQSSLKEPLCLWHPYRV